MYRPTVRYDDVYRDYVNDVFRATNLDRNQIIRLALFLLPHSEKGNEILSKYLKQDASLPSPRWPVSRRTGQVYKNRTDTGTIRISIG